MIVLGLCEIMPMFCWKPGSPPAGQRTIADVQFFSRGGAIGEIPLAAR